MLMEQVGGGQKAGGDGTCRRWRQKGPRRQRDKGPRSVLISSAFITNPQHCLHRRPISATSDECCSVQLSDGDGSFNDTGIESFIKEVKLHECGLSYAVVSIMGPQSSVATPKQIRELMQVDGLTNDEVKSHLQKYQLHTRRLPATTTTTTPANQSGLVLGGGHAWMCQDQFGESSKGSSSQSGSP
ncbi:hypothetical protein E1A91_D06G213200v1 [Gossypium mustelinum]|nr:hypothetical protein ES332_D06G230200v1 [Gossypium tomentosum]TYI78457.1 hypothetical protein E1A91_D06G213200v1 [Gossypium mustelinum]